MKNKNELAEFYAAHMLANVGRFSPYDIMNMARELAEEAIARREGDKVINLTRIEKKHPRYGKFRFWLRSLKIRVQELLLL